MSREPAGLDVPAAPYVWEPRRLWSLWDMQRFHAPSFAAAMTEMGRAATGVALANQAGLLADDDLDRRIIGEALQGAQDALADVPLSATVQAQFFRLKKALKDGNPSELAILVREFHANVTVELAASWFLMVPAPKRELYEQRAVPFGDGVAQAFPDAARDIAAASRCLALDEWTACVFHLMRALEHGLHKTADSVGLPPEAMALENWKNVIDQIEKKIRAIESEPKTPEKSERIRFLSQAAAQFRYFKDAWRNHVSHSRITYDWSSP